MEGDALGRVKSGCDEKPIEPLRLRSSTEVGQGQNTADTVGDRYAGEIRPETGCQVSRKLQLIRLAGDGQDVEDDVRT